MISRLFIAFLLTISCFFLGESADFPGKKSNWKGFERFDFELNGRKCIVVKPKSPAQGNPWILRARFFGHQPQADLALLEKGFYLTCIHQYLD